MSGAAVEVASPAAMEALGRRFGAALLGARPATPGGVVVGLEGELGAGKTTFVQGLVEGVTGAAQRVTSPTFQLMNLYRPAETVADGGARAAAEFRTLAHIDAYRLVGAQAFWELGIAELLEENVIIVVEWPSRTQHAIFETEAVLLSFEHLFEVGKENVRRVRVERIPPGMRIDWPQ
ncbi:MAG: tRNA (adenosine(37)-N6)-threonylcarbamoyltransferase complex ATPase subunit type 1 TsaE [Planctomycetota bacterium]